MKALIKTLILDENADRNGCDAILILPEVAEQLLELRKQCLSVLKLDGLYAVSFFDYNFTVVSEDQYANIDVENADVLKVPDNRGIKKADFRVDCATVKIKKDGCLWSFYEKHSSVRFESELIDWDTLESMATKVKAS